MRTDYPSWQHSIEHGATTVWERWDGYVDGSGFQTPAMNSMNHPALGSVAEWLHAYVAGLRPGSRAVQIRPYPGGGLTNAVHSDAAVGATLRRRMGRSNRIISSCDAPFHRV